MNVYGTFYWVPLQTITVNYTHFCGKGVAQTDDTWENVVVIIGTYVCNSSGTAITFEFDGNRGRLII